MGSNVVLETNIITEFLKIESLKFYMRACLEIFGRSADDVTSWLLLWRGSLLGVP